MKSLKSIVEKIILLFVILVSFSCASSSVPRTVDMGGYTFTAPPGSGWEMRWEKTGTGSAMLSFQKPKRIWTGYVAGSTKISIAEYDVNPKNWHSTEEEIANNFRNGEEKGTRESFAKKQDGWELTDVQQSTVTVAGKKLYAMHCKIRRGIVSVKAAFTKGAGYFREQETMMYLYFPEDFRVRHEFYVFFIHEDKEQGNLVATIDLTQIDPVVESFKIPGCPIEFPIGINGDMIKAAATGETEKIKDMLQKGADPNATNSVGCTALMYVAMIGDREVASLLIDKGANLSAKNNQGRTPLSFAVKEDSIEMAAFLTDKGADVNAQMNDGWTPLMEAVNRNNIKIVRVLLAKGADIKIRRKDGLTAVDMAEKRGDVEMVRLLLNREAEVKK